jgi:hypothetical protein
MKAMPVGKQCECCGEWFQCGQFPCWCPEIAITDHQYDWIAARYSDCLCPACLTKVSRGDAGGPLPEGSSG